MRRELRTGTPGNVPGEAETGLLRCSELIQGVRWSTGGQPVMKLPRESQASQLRDPCLFWVAHLCVQLTRMTLALSFLLTEESCSVCPGAGEEGRDGTDQSPQSWAQGVHREILRAFPCLCLCVFAFQRGEQAYLLLVAGGREGEGSLILCRGEVGGNRRGSRWGRKPCSALRRRL